MDRILEICDLLARKKEQLTEYERETAAIVTGDADSIAKHLERRASLQCTIDGLSRRLDALCPAGGPLRNAVGLSCDWGDLPEDVRVVFDGAMQVRAVIQRIQREEPQAAARIVEERDAAAERLRALNQGKEGAAARYLKSTRLSAHHTDRGNI